MLNRSDLEKLSLSPTEEELVAGLGVSTAAGLLSIMRISPDLFLSHWGTHRTEQVMSCLNSMISSDERAILERPASRFNIHGAMISESPSISAAHDIDIAERDRLFDELKRLRLESPTESSSERIAQLERRLNEILEHS